jgi:chemotaxis protein methyltransferase CheR
MDDHDCTEFLQWSLPRLRLRWEGFRKVRKQVCKRLGRRIEELGLSGLPNYRRYLDRNPEEWQVLDSLCGITMSRFYRDRIVFDALRDHVLPMLAGRVVEEAGDELRCWSAGCSSGEEPFTLQIIWSTCVMPLIQRELPLRITATDVNEKMLERARRGLYATSSLRELPEVLREAFVPSGDFYLIGRSFREHVEFVRQDIRRQLPAGSFHLILCRNLVFTYFSQDLQREILGRIFGKLLPGGVLVIGRHEYLPAGVPGLRPLGGSPVIFRKEAGRNDEEGATRSAAEMWSGRAA